MERERGVGKRLRFGDSLCSIGVCSVALARKGHDSLSRD